MKFNKSKLVQSELSMNCFTVKLGSASHEDGAVGEAVGFAVIMTMRSR